MKKLTKTYEKLFHIKKALKDFSRKLKCTLQVDKEFEKFMSELRKD